MATNEQLDQMISGWLEETAPARIPERVFSATFERTRKSRQQPSWRALLGRPEMLRFATALGSAAVLVVVVAVAVNFYVNQQGIAGPLTASPSSSPALLAPTATPSATPSALTSGGMWPQTTLEEIRQAQVRADDGDPDYTWQVDPLLEQHNDDGGRSWMRLVEGQPEIADRFLREVLGWDEYIVNVYAGRADSNEAADGVYSDIGYLRCAPGEANRLEQSDTCKPTLDELHYETVSIDLAQLDKRGPDGIWVVSGWRATEPYAPVTAVTALVGNFLQARIDGQGAEAMVYSTAEATDIPLLYTTTTGSRYARYEIELVRGPLWAAGYMDFDIRLFADGGQTVVEQEMRWVYWSPGVPTLWPSRTTENGQPVTVRYGFLDGMATAFATYPWERSCGQDCLAWWSGSGAGYVSLTVGSVTITDACLQGRTDPVSVTIGGLAAVMMDGTGGTDCGLFGDWVGARRPVRIYVVDLPDGSPVPNLAIAVGAEGAPFDDVIEAATPIIESIEFHMP